MRSLRAVLGGHSVMWPPYCCSCQEMTAVAASRSTSHQRSPQASPRRSTLTQPRNHRDPVTASHRAGGNPGLVDDHELGGNVANTYVLVYRRFAGREHGQI